MNYKKVKQKGIKQSLLVLSCICLFLFFRYFLAYLIPFLLGYLIASIAYKLLHRLSSITRIIIFILSYIILFVLLYLLSYYLVRHISNTIPLISNAYVEFLSQINHQPYFYFIETISNHIIPDLIMILSNIAITLPQQLFNVMIMIMASFFFFIDYELINHHLNQLFDKLRIKHLSNDIKLLIKNYLLAMLKMSSFIFISVFIAFTLINIPQSLLLALLTSILDAFPIIGIGAMFFPLAIYYFCLHSSQRAIMIIIAYVIISLLRSLIEPHLYGKQFQIPNYLMFMAFTINFQLFGINAIFITPIILFLYQIIILNKSLSFTNS